MSDEAVTKVQEMVYEIRVGQVMTRNVVSVTPEMPMSELRKVLHDNRISGTPVVADGRLVGIISVEDFIRWLTEGSHECPIAERMTRDVRAIYEDEPLVQAVNKIERLGFGRLPVLERSAGRLVGVITKGDVVAGLLKHLAGDYRETEMRRVRSSHLFADIVADESALLLEYRVPGADFKRAGAGASGLKATLQRLGIPPQTARRAAIAAYEAEMNLIIFTPGGRLSVRLDPERIRMVVEDHGPGIADVEKALQPGFSTAPDWVRELGFGAGMGLPNIRKCSDRMNLESVVGKGTRLELEFLLERQDDAGRDGQREQTRP